MGGGGGVQMVLTEPLPLMNAAANGVYSNAKTLLDVKFIYYFGDSITVNKTVYCWHEYIYLYKGFITTTASFKMFKWNVLHRWSLIKK